MSSEPTFPTVQIALVRAEDLQPGMVIRPPRHHTLDRDEPWRWRRIHAVIDGAKGDGISKTIRAAGGHPDSEEFEGWPFAYPEKRRTSLHFDEIALVLMHPRTRDDAQAPDTVDFGLIIIERLELFEVQVQTPAEDA